MNEINVGAAETVERTGEILQSAETLDQIIGRLGEVGNRIRKINSRVFDNQSGGVESTDAPKPVRSGHMGQVVDRLEDVHAAIGAIESQIEHLEGL